ncbi:uracil-DNA glycosylase [Halobellus ordinarius]|uniref:uracil-DNA glycosylase n=1 Tax=Halobellus ordinarius TaxID=3075120 RepID=UPI0028804557|nr:uracil-DNA glycosylase family protein [Halobellus sp. ZY16]
MSGSFPDSRHVLEPGCDRCPELVACRECISWGTGDRDAAVMVVGEAPGAGDPEAATWRGGNWTGKAYTTRHSGRRVRELLAAVGRPDAYVTNAVKCFPCDGEGSNREPTATERANCRTHLRRELATVDPAALLTTGKHATASVLALDGRTLDGFLDRVLEPIDLDCADATVVPLLHPSYQDVWRSRLDYTPAEYRAAVREAIDAAVG